MSKQKVYKIMFCNHIFIGIFSSAEKANEVIEEIVNDKSKNRRHFSSYSSENFEISEIEMDTLLW